MNLELRLEITEDGIWNISLAHVSKKRRTNAGYWSTAEKMRIMQRALEIGCGNFPKLKGQGVEYLDKEEVNCKPLTVWDLEKTPLPYGDNVFDKIVASHVLEHVTNFMPLMKELHRILKKNGILEVWVPFVRDYDHAFGDPTHVRYFDVKTFKYFDPIHKQSNIVYEPHFDVTVGKIHYYESPTFRSRLHKLSWMARHPTKSFRTAWLHVIMRAVK